MKKGIHPENYRPVVFKDMSNGDMLSFGKVGNLQFFSPVLYR